MKQTKKQVKQKQVKAPKSISDEPEEEDDILFDDDDDFDFDKYKAEGDLSDSSMDSSRSCLPVGYRGEISYPFKPMPWMESKKMNTLSLYSIIHHVKFLRYCVINIHLKEYRDNILQTLDILKTEMGKLEKKGVKQ